MGYAVARIYSGLDKSGVEQVASLAIKELAPKLSQAGGLVRYATIAWADGRFGSFSLYHDGQAAKRGSQVAADWVKTQPAMKPARLEEMLEGEVAFQALGNVNQNTRLHGIVRIYNTRASVEELKHALESDAGQTARRSFAGLARYTAVKLTDGRLAIFGAFDSAENARNSSAQAKAALSRTESQLSRLLTSAPEIREGTVLGTYQKEVVA